MLNFKYNYRVSKITIPDNIILQTNTIANRFSNLNNLKQINFNCSHITNMSYAFNNCRYLNTFPANIDNVVYMRNAFQNCRNLTGNPICGLNTIDMAYAYSNCIGLNGSPVCSNNINQLVNMAYAYYNCQNLIGAPVIPGNFANMAYAYYNCQKLTGPIFPLGATQATQFQDIFRNCYNLDGEVKILHSGSYSDYNFSNAFANCYNLKGPIITNINSRWYPVYINLYSTFYNCTNLLGGFNIGTYGNMDYTYYNCHRLAGSVPFNYMYEVDSLISTFENCYNLTGRAYCSEWIENMYCTYANCYNLSIPASGRRVVYMDYTYRNCYNLIGPPVCRPITYSLQHTYSNCYNLKGNAVCGSNTWSMNYAYYNCYSLDGFPACGNNVYHMEYTYYNCQNLTGTAIIGPKVSYANYTYYNCFNINNIVIYSSNLANLNNTFEGIPNNVPIYIYSNMIPLYLHADSWQPYKNRIWLLNNEFEFIDPMPKSIILNSNETRTITVEFINKLDSNLNITYESSNTNIADIIDFNINNSKLIFNVKGYDFGDSIITLFISNGYCEKKYDINISIVEQIPYLTENTGFVLNDNGYYESTNKSTESDMASCKINFFTDGEHYVTLDTVAYGDFYDFCDFYRVDSQSETLKEFRAEEIMTDPQSIGYGKLEAGEHYIYIRFYKYRNHTHNNFDSLQFQLRFTKENN